MVRACNEKGSRLKVGERSRACNEKGSRLKVG